ncbi:MAG: lytic transglycosylase domain-containing protein [Longimicrobiales bacterium]
MRRSTSRIRGRFERWPLARPALALGVLAVALLLGPAGFMGYAEQRAARQAAERAEAERELIRTLAAEYGVPEELAERIHVAARSEGVPSPIAFGLVFTESSFRPRVVSSAGAVGYTQLLPSTASWLVPGTDRSDLFRPETNLRIGFRYLRYLLKYYDGDLRLALTAYNRGPGTVDSMLETGRDPDNGYAERVLRRNAE